MIKAYLRCSTEKQNEIRQLENVIKGHGAEKIYLDKRSGKDTNRPELQKMLDELQDGDTVLVHEVSRLARSVVDLIKLVEDITSKGAKLHFINEGMIFDKSSNDPMQKAYLQMIGVFAELQRNLINKSCQEGREIAKAQGKYKGRKTELCIGGKDEARYKAIVKAINSGMAISEIRNIYKVGMGQIYRIKNELKQIEE